jgi:hypothetical protein
MKFKTVLSITFEGLSLNLDKFGVFIPWMFFIPYSGVGIFSYPVSQTKPTPYRKSDKLTGFDIGDLIPEWVKFKYPSEHLIVLTEVNVQAKNIQFWAKIPKTDSQFFLKDLVVLFCKDKSEVIRLVENIPRDFADAKGFSAGELLIDNED